MKSRIEKTSIGRIEVFEEPVYGVSVCPYCRVRRRRRKERKETGDIFKGTYVARTCGLQICLSADRIRKENGLPYPRVGSVVEDKPDLPVGIGNMIVR